MTIANVFIISSSAGFLDHARLSLGPTAHVETAAAARQVIPSMCRDSDVLIVHASCPEMTAGDGALERLKPLGKPIAVAADVPDLREMLDLSRHGICAYFNSYMTDVHYRQMISLLRQGLTWFSPPMMADAMALARQTLDLDEQLREDALEPLTEREREIAVDVAAGKSNREIAEVRHITERTVKSHLTRIFRKLGTRNRHALAMKLRGS